MTDGAAVGPGGKLVLVVDDSNDMRGLIRDVLTEQGYEVLTASSGGRALGMMAERLPDLVITDLMMPGMNGFTFRGEMLRRPALAEVPVIVLTAFWHRGPETLDAVDVLPKPLNLDRLLGAVKRVLAGDGAAGAPGAPGSSAAEGAGGFGTASASPEGESVESVERAAEGGEPARRNAHAGGIQQEA